AAVVKLTEGNFDSYVDGSKHAFVEFFAPWCGHCKSLEPEWAIAGETYQEGDDVVIGAVDATENMELADKYSVAGYPTIKYFPKGSTEAEDYQGGRTADTIVSYVNQKAGLNRKVKKTPTAVTDLTDANFEQIALSNEKAVMVKFYAPWCGHCKTMAPKYDKLASIFSGEKDVVVAKVDATEAYRLNMSNTVRYEITGYPTVKFFPFGSTVPVSYDGPREVESMLSYLNEQANTFRSLSGELTEIAGRITHFDDIIATAAKLDQALVDKLKVAAATVDESVAAEHVKEYIKTSEKIVAKGVEYVEKEIARLTGMISKATVTAEKKTSFMFRRNILKAFQL
ncbi:unnamed protein product, partial [Ectocarpus fasciculatus]